MRLDVAFATVKQQLVVSIDVSSSTTIDEAITLSGLPNEFPQYDLLTLPVGVYGKRILDKTSFMLCNGDRIEIYRPLQITPNQQRQLRAK